MVILRLTFLSSMCILILPGCAGPKATAKSQTGAPRVPQALDVIKAGLAYQANPVVRAESVEALESIPSPEVRPWLRSALLDDHAGVRFAACMVVGKLQDTRASSMIGKLRSDPNESVRVAAIYAMHRLGDTSQTSKLPNYVLLHPDPIVRRNAVIALSQLGDKSAVTVLARAMKDEDPGVRHHALEGMARLGNKEAARELSFMANSGLGSEEVFAINALAATRDPTFEDAFRYKLSSGTHLETRLAAARALGQLGIGAGAEVVLGALKPSQQVRPDPEDPPLEQLLRIRQLASAAAGAIGDPRLLSALEPLLQNGNDPRVQVSAARAIVEITEKQKTSPLTFSALRSG